MLTDRTPIGPNGSEQNGEIILEDIVKVLESAGFTGERLSEAVAQLREQPIELFSNGNSQENGHSNDHSNGTHNTGPETDVDLALTDNARVILEKRYLQTDRPKNPQVDLS